MDIETLLSETKQALNPIVYLTGEIEEDHFEIAKELLAYHFNKDFKGTVTMVISSQGGSCDVSWSIIDIMNFVRYPIQTVAVGTVASAAADIFCNGDFRVIGESSTLMLHPHSTTMEGSHTRLIAAWKGDSIEHERRLRHYASTSKYKTPAEVQKVLFSTIGDDLYLTPEEVLTHGLADEISRCNKEDRRRKARAEFTRTTRVVEPTLKTKSRTRSKVR